MKYLRMFCSFLLIISLFISTASADTISENNLSSSTESDKDYDEKIISDYSIEDDFVDDTVLLVLKKEYSKDGKDYTAEDFNIECTEIKDLSPFANNTIRQQIELIQETFEMSTMDLSLDTQIDTVVQQKLLELDEKLKLVNVEKHRRILKITLKHAGKENVLAAIKVLEKLPFVRSASPDLYNSPCAVETNDPYFDTQWALESICLPKCWEITTGYNKVKVGIIDTGITLSHPEFSGVIEDNENQDFYYNRTLADFNGHGTMVAGIIGATTNNEIGIAAANHNVELIPLKTGGTEGILITSSVLNAIDYAQKNNISILNYSAGSYSPLPALYDKLLEYQGQFICSAGN